MNIVTTSTPLKNLQAYAEAQIRKHNIPGLSLAVWHQGKLHKAAAGILNVDTGVEATTDSIFRIASITKVFTTSLVMQMVDERLVDLDKPVKKYLKDFQVADSHATEVITVRQLLNHTSGIAGDFFPDDSRQQGNLIKRYVDRCNLLPVIHPVGEMHSYSNSAFAIAGRLIEVMRGMSWYQAIDEYVFKPLDMTHAVADPKAVVRYRVAMGHLNDGNRWVLPERDYRTLGTAPGGSTLMMSAEDLITFTRAHLCYGLSSVGERWISVDSAKIMQTPVAVKPKLSSIKKQYIGLGWGVTDFDQTKLRTIGHMGTTNGSLSAVLAIPEQDSVFVVLVNAHKYSARDDISRELLLALTGTDNREPEPSFLEKDINAFKFVCGCYESFNTLINIELCDGQLHMSIVNKISPIGPEKKILKPIDNERFVIVNEHGFPTKTVVFLGPDRKGVPQYLLVGGRINPRI